MNYRLIQCIKLMLTFSEGTSAEAEIRKDKTITQLSFDEKADSIDIESAKQGLTTSTGYSYFMMYFEGSDYKVMTYLLCDHSPPRLVTKVKVEKCHLAKVKGT